MRILCLLCSGDIWDRLERGGQLALIVEKEVGIFTFGVVYFWVLRQGERTCNMGIWLFSRQHLLNMIMAK